MPCWPLRGSNRSPRFCSASSTRRVCLPTPALRWAAGSRLPLAWLDGAVAFETLLRRLGEPIRYGYTSRPWPLEAYQNVYATTPGSAEMPSAGRPFTPGLITALVARGVLVAPGTLQTGVSSPECDEPPFPEPYQVPISTARS